MLIAHDEKEADLRLSTGIQLWAALLAGLASGEPKPRRQSSLPDMELVYRRLSSPSRSDWKDDGSRP